MTVIDTLHGFRCFFEKSTFDLCSWFSRIRQRCFYFFRIKLCTISQPTFIIEPKKQPHNIKLLWGCMAEMKQCPWYPLCYSRIKSVVCAACAMSTYYFITKNSGKFNIKRQMMIHLSLYDCNIRFK